MIVVKEAVTAESVSQTLFFILDPGSVEMMKRGMPLVRDLKALVPDLNLEVQLFIAYSPDSGWVEQKIGEGVPLVDAIVSSLDRDPELRLTANIESEIGSRGQIVAEDIYGVIYSRIVTADEGTSCYEYGFSLDDSPDSVQWGYFDIEAVTKARRQAYDSRPSEGKP